MDNDFFVVLHSQVPLPALADGDLHEKARDEASPDGGVVGGRAHVWRGQVEVEPLHDPRELGPDVVCRPEGAGVEKVVKGPVLGCARVPPRVVHVEQREVVALGVCKERVGGVGLALGRLWAGKDPGDREAGHNGEHLVRAPEL